VGSAVGAKGESAGKKETARRPFASRRACEGRPVSRNTIIRTNSIPP